MTVAPRELVRSEREARPRYDYVIIGAGSAGCALAGRLTEDPHVTVLLIEAGGWDRHPLMRIPIGWGRVIRNPR